MPGIDALNLEAWEPDYMKSPTKPADGWIGKHGMGRGRSAHNVHVKYSQRIRVPFGRYELLSDRSDIMGYLTTHEYAAVALMSLSSLAREAWPATGSVALQLRADPETGAVGLIAWVWGSGNSQSDVPILIDIEDRIAQAARQRTGPCSLYGITVLLDHRSNPSSK